MVFFCCVYYCCVHYSATYQHACGDKILTNLVICLQPYFIALDMDLSAKVVIICCLGTVTGVVVMVSQMSLQSA